MRRAAALAAIVLAAGWLVTYGLAPWDDESVTDLPSTAANAARFLDGELPYRDVSFEYPTLAWPVVAAGGIAGTGVDDYRIGLGIVIFLLALAVVLLCGRLAAATGGNPVRATIAAALLPLLVGAVVRTHFDLAAVALLLVALLAFARDRTVLGGALLGAAVLTKGFPLAAAPVVLAWLWARGGRRELMRGALAVAVTGGTLALAAVAMSPDGAWHALHYQLDRPAQIESSQALVLSALGGDHVFSHGADSITHGSADLVAWLFLGAFTCVVALLTVSATARPADPRTLVLGSLTAVAAFAAFGEVLSPQFLTWVLPLGALAVAWGTWPLAVSVATASLLTLVGFPGLYLELLDGEPAAIAVLAVRDVALIVVVGLAAAEISRPAEGPARSTWPGRRRRRRSRPRSATDRRPRSRSERASA